MITLDAARPISFRVQLDVPLVLGLSILACMGIMVLYSAGGQDVGSAGEPARAQHAADQDRCGRCRASVAPDPTRTKRLTRLVTGNTLGKCRKLTQNTPAR